jgi:hypothetical protein
VIAILERSGIDLVNCRNLPPLPDHCRFAVERRGHLWKGLIARSRSEVSQLLRNGCSDGKFREAAVNPPATRIRHRDCAPAVDRLPYSDCERLLPHGLDRELRLTRLPETSTSPALSENTRSLSPPHSILAVPPRHQSLQNGGARSHTQCRDKAPAVCLEERVDERSGTEGFRVQARTRRYTRSGKRGLFGTMPSSRKRMASN